MVSGRKVETREKERKGRKAEDAKGKKSVGREVREIKNNIKDNYITEKG